MSNKHTLTQAVFWDYDNTLIATAEAHWHKHQIVLQRYDIVLEEKHRPLIYSYNGNQNWEWMNRDYRLEEKVSKENYLYQVDEVFKQTMVDLPFRPGVTEAIALIKSLGIPQGIVTNARRLSAAPLLEAKRISSEMVFILYSEDYIGKKPLPDPYLKGLEIMQAHVNQPIAAMHCLAIEDDPKGVESAKKAGLTTIHRKLKLEDAPSPFADHSCFDGGDFLQIIQSFLI